MPSASVVSSGSSQVGRWARRTGLLGALLVLAASAASAQQRVLITGVSLTVDGNNVVTVNTDGSIPLSPAIDVGTAGTYAFINGWGYASGDGACLDTNGNTAWRINSAAGVQIPSTNRICNTNGSASGSVRLSGNTTLGAALRAALGVGSGMPYTSNIANGSPGTFAVSGTVTIAAALPSAILLTGVNVDVDGSNNVTVNSDGSVSLSPAFNVGTAGTFAFVNGWGYASGDVACLDTNGNTAWRINSAAGVQVPSSNRICNTNGSASGSARLSGNTTLGAALRAAFGVGNGFAYASIISNGNTPTFGVSGTVNVAPVGPPQADLSITKTDGVGSEIPGTPVTYTIVAANAGPAPANGAGVADTFPGILSGCTWTSVAAGGATGNTNGAGNLANTLNMPAASSVTYTATCNIAPAATGSLTNTATISAPMGILDPNSGNNSATDIDTLTPSSDKSITKTDGSATEIPGTPVTYTIVAANAGPSNAVGVAVTDTFPGILSGCAWTSVAAGGATGNTNGSGNLGDTLNLPVGSSVTYTATCDIAPTATGSLANTASIATTQDPSTANNSATDTDTLVPTADVGVTKSDGTATAIPGTNTVYAIVASNAGPSAAPAAQITDTFPAACTSVDWTCAGAGGGICPAANGSGNLNASVDLPVGGSVSFNATCAISATATGTLTNTATGAAGAGVTDPNGANNAATDIDTLVPTADVGVTKSDGTTTAVPGTSTVYAIQASNAGPSAAPAAQVTDTFPAACTSVDWTCAGAGGGICPAANGSGNLNASVDLPVGGSVTFNATCAISAAASGDLINTANVAAGAGVTDPNAANNSATDTDTLVPMADITVAKTVDPTAVDVGDTVTYTILVANAGPSDAPGVTVTDFFPIECQANLAWTCTPAGGATCTPAGTGDIVDVVGLPAGSNLTYVATCSAYSGTDADVVNTASAAVPAGVIDPDPANSSASATVTINAFAIQEIPTLGRTGLVVLLLLIGFAGWITLRRTH